MKTAMIPLQNLISELSQYNDPMDEWPEWLIGQHIQYMLEGETTDLESLFNSVFDRMTTEIILGDNKPDLTRLTTDIKNYKDDIVDFSVNHLGVLLYLRG